MDLSQTLCCFVFKLLRLEKNAFKIVKYSYLCNGDLDSDFLSIEKQRLV